MKDRPAILVFMIAAVSAESATASVARVLRRTRSHLRRSMAARRLSRLGRSLKHQVMLLDELQSLGVAFESLGDLMLVA
ncbi:MAG TPA: recombinase family protein [Vicinamibacterales bacterium]